jgi:hypothetical protein
MLQDMGIRTGSREVRRERKLSYWGVIQTGRSKYPRDMLVMSK